MVGLVLLGAANPAHSELALGPEPAVGFSLEQTGRRLLPTGDPVWELRLSLPGEPVRRFDALVGRASAQGADRQRLGSHAPLPPGRYRVGPIVPVPAGLNPELGRSLWIDLQPLFSTARRALGIHLDPSAGLGAESGTEGCIGLIHAADLEHLGELLRRHRVRLLQVVS
ncbi:L,D-transpeptidase [Cyanobium sp. Morenito 9A2]|nr:L,D-transpeptidase [Cyanobium sp. Morenito 9A2]